MPACSWPVSMAHSVINQASNIQAEVMCGIDQLNVPPYAVTQ